MAVAAAVLLTGFMFTAGYGPLLALFAGLLLAATAAAGWRRASPGLPLVGVGVTSIVILCVTVVPSNVVFLSGSLTAAVLVGALVRRFLCPWITLPDTVIGGALGVSTGHVAGVLLDDHLHPDHRWLSGEALIWTPAILVFAGSLPLLLLLGLEFWVRQSARP